MIEIGDKKIYFPLKYIPKKYQLDALDFIKKSILTGNKFILNELATGVGKSYLVILFSNWYRNFVNTDNNVKIDIITNSKVLQEQYLKDFDFIKNYKGKSNYYCDVYQTDCSTGKDLCGILKNNCNSCPYDQARNSWISSEMGLTNFHLFNTLSIFQPETLKSRGGNVLIIDECQSYESVFSSYLDTKISANILKKCGLTLKEIDNFDNKFISKIKDINKYLEFIERKLEPTLQEKKDFFENKIKTSSTTKNKKEFTKYLQNINSKLLSFKYLFESYKKDPSNIALDVIINKKEKMYSGVELISQHIFIYEFLNEYVWKHYDHVIFMSATILDKKLFSFINGLDDNITTYNNVPSPFKIKNRPLYYLKIGKMNYSNKEETFKKQLIWIKKILLKYKNQKGIIHTTNYEIAGWLRDGLMNERLIFHDIENRNEMLDKHIGSTEPTVLVSPSMMEGISLDEDLARFQILLKINYPNLSSNKIKARKKAKPEWYSWSAVINTIQATGRGVRGDNDYCDTFILDSNFSDLLKYNSQMIPKYFTDAIKTLKV